MWGSAEEEFKDDYKGLPSSFRVPFSLTSALDKNYKYWRSLIPKLIL